jgi:hypothetical protein
MIIDIVLTEAKTAALVRRAKCTRYEYKDDCATAYSEGSKEAAITFNNPSVLMLETLDSVLGEATKTKPAKKKEIDDGPKTDSK